MTDKTMADRLEWFQDQIDELQSRVNNLEFERDQLVGWVRDLEFTVDQLVNPEGCCGP